MQGHYLDGDHLVHQDEYPIVHVVDTLIPDSEVMLIHGYKKLIS